MRENKKRKPKSPENNKRSNTKNNQRKNDKKEEEERRMRGGKPDYDSQATQPIDAGDIRSYNAALMSQSYVFFCGVSSIILFLFLIIL